MTDKNTPGNAFFFIQISDPQLGMITANRDFVKEIELTTRAVEIVNRLAPGFVILTGDMVNEPGDAAQVDQAQQLLGRIEPRYYVLPGNHDVGDAPTESLLKAYRDSFGPDWYSFNFQGRHFIVLNSCLLYNDQNAPDDHRRQWDWLEQDLRRMPAGQFPPIVFQHHPMFLHNQNEDDQYFNIPRAARSRYLAKLTEFGVNTIIAGHLHQNNIAQDQGLSMITTGPVGLSLGAEPSGLRVFYVDGRQIRHKYFGLDTPPTRLDPSIL